MAENKTEKKINRLEKQIAELKQRVGSSQDFAGNVKGRLESGEGFGEAFKGGISDKVTDIKEAFSAKGMKKLGKKAYMETFSGKDIFSSYMRGRLNKNKSDDSPESPEEAGEKGGASGLDLKEVNVFLKIIAKNSTSLHMMSRDINVMRQNIVKMTKIETKKPSSDKKKTYKKEKDNDAVTKADAFFLREDEREAKLESERAKFTEKDKSPKQEKKEDSCGGICGAVMDTITGMIKTGLMTAIKAIFNPKNLVKLLGKVFVIATILAALFQGIMAGWNKWKETGDLWEAIKAGLVGIIDFLTLGLFGEDNIKKMFDAVGNFIDSIVDSIKDVINAIKDWVANNVGIPKFSIPVPKFLQKLGAPEEIPFGPWYPFKNDPSSTQPQVTPKSAETKKREPDGQVPSEKPTVLAAEPNEQDKFEKSLGVTRNASTGLPQYKGVPFFEPASKEELKRVVDAIDSGEEGYKYKSVDPVTGKEIEKTLSLKPVNPTTAPGQEPASPTPVVASAGAGADAAASSGSSGGTSAPTETPAGPAQAAPAASSPAAESNTTVPSGASLAKESSDIAEAQRMESAADMGSIINAPSTTSNKVNSSAGKSTIASAWDKTFLDFYATT
jgi:hypothetical protein